MDSLLILISALTASIAALTEVLKGLLAKAAPSLTVNPKILSLIASVLVGLGVYFAFAPENGGLVGALLFAFLSSAGVYDHAIKPVKEFWAAIRGYIGK